MVTENRTYQDYSLDDIKNGNKDSKDSMYWERTTEREKDKRGWIKKVDTNETSRETKNKSHQYLYNI